MAMPVPSVGVPPPVTSAANSLHTGHFGPHHVYQYPTTFLLQDKTMFTGDLRKGTRVFNPDGSIAFQTRDAVLTLRNKEVVYDAVNAPMASLHKKSLSVHGTWQIFRGDSVSSADHVADIKPSLLDIAGKSIKVVLNGQSEPVFVIKGNFRGKQFVFTDANGRVIAESKRQGKFHSVTNYLSGEDTFTLTVQPGIDTALIVLVTLVIDDILEPNK